MEGLFSLTNVPVLLIFSIVFLLCYLYLGRSANFPPGPPGLPILGSFLWWNGLEKKGIKQYQALFEASKTYRDIISFKLLGQRLVYLHGYETIREAFVKNGDVFSDRPSWLRGLQEAIKEGKEREPRSRYPGRAPILHTFVRNRKMLMHQKESLRPLSQRIDFLAQLSEVVLIVIEEGVGLQSGHPWKVLRKFVLQTLRDFGVGKTSLEQKIMREVDAASEFLYATDGKPSDVRLLTSMMITNGYERRGRYACTMQWIKAYIYDEINNHESTFDNENIRDFTDLYLQAKMEQADENIFNKGNMFRVILELFIAGSETTSNTINWCILYMQEYPDIQKKCQDEISEKCGDKVVTWADRGSFPYIEATLFEIQRMANIAPITVPHTNEVDVNFGGYFIPRRTVIIANLYSSSMDLRHWDQPEIFNPERFMEDGKLKKNPALIPFSIGPRICLGESLAQMEMFLIFTNLLQRFTFCREDDNIKHSLENIFEQTTSAPKPYRTRAIKRT